MELYHIVLICLIVWSIYCFTSPIIRPSITDIKFKKLLKQEITRLEQREIQLGLKGMVTKGVDGQ